MAKIIKFPKIPLDRVKLLLIDVDDTLYRYKPCHIKALDCCFEAISQDPRYPEWRLEDFKELYLASRQEVTKRLYPQGACRSRLIAFLHMFEKLGIKSPYGLALEYDKLYWNTLINAIEPEKDALKLLHEALDRKIKVIAVTDMLSNIQIKKIQKMGMEKYIRTIVTSEEAGCEKPSPQIFQMALEKGREHPEKTIMVGDSYEKDGLGAESCGIKFFKVVAEDDV